MGEVPLEELAELIRPSGYYHIKAKRLRAFLAFFKQRYAGSFAHMFARPLSELRAELLDISGIGPETADAILLYAGDLPIFVVDAYTKRIFSRHDLIPEKATYDDMQRFAMQNLPKSVPIYNEFHAQIVMIGKTFCKRQKPNCEQCPLQHVPFSKHFTAAYPQVLKNRSE